MYEHVSAVKTDSIAERPPDQRRDIANALERWQKASAGSKEVRIKTYARNTLQISLPSQQPPVKGAVTEEQLSRSLADLPGDLVYSAKVQHTGEVLLKPAARKKSPELTGYAKGWIRDACQILKEDFGTDCYFFTATLPGSTQSAIETLAEHSTEILNALLQRLRYWMRKLTPPGDFTAHSYRYAVVWEYQERGALHLHLVVGIKTPEVAEKIGSLFKGWWRHILETYSDKTGVDLFKRLNGRSWRKAKNLPKCDFEKVRKDVGRYMSKYISKEKKEKVSPNAVPPSRWWCVSKPLRERALAERGLNAMKCLNQGEAVAFATACASLAQDMGGEVHEMNNPVTKACCGFTVFWNNENKDECYRLWNEAMELWKVESPTLTARGSPVAEFPMGETTYSSDPYLIFEGRALDVDLAACADFGAPFSASEKGGGMR